MDEYEKIKVLLSAAKQTYANGEINPEEFLALLEDIEACFLSVQKKNEEEDVRRILNKYIANLP